MTAEAVIRLTRLSAWPNRFRAFSVYIDGRKVGAIRNGRVADFPVVPGIHQLFVKVDWCCSNIIKVDVCPDSIVQFACGKSLVPSGQQGIAALSDIPGTFISIWMHPPEA